MIDGGRVAEGRVGASQPLGHAGMSHGETLDVGLVDDRFV